MFYFLDAQGKQKYQPPNRSWMARHENRRRKSVDEEEDYDFKTKRQIVNEFEFAPETEENLDTLEGQFKDDLLDGALAHLSYLIFSKSRNNLN